jgi:hypothetical protein
MQMSGLRYIDQEATSCGGQGAHHVVVKTMTVPDPVDQRRIMLERI